jgi:hypothetical protein
MSKGRYRSVECKQVNWQQLIEQASGQALVFAVDVAKEAFFGLLQVKGGAGLCAFAGAIRLRRGSC